MSLVTPLASTIIKSSICTLYLALGTFLLNNYWQATTITSKYTDLLPPQMSKYSLKETDLKEWLEEEKKYLSNLTQEPEADTLGIAYVKALQNLAKAEQAFEGQRSGIAEPTLKEGNRLDHE